MPMKTFSLNNGKKIPAVGLGTWQSNKTEVGNAVGIALNKGYTHIDGASVYANEDEVGEAYKSAWENGALKREQIFIVSKLWCKNFAKEDVVISCKKTLLDLKLEYLDLYLVHFPIRFDKNMNVGQDKKGIIGYTPELMKETWQQMEALVDQGLVKSIGVSNFTTVKIEDLLKFARIKPVCNQVEMHPYLPQKKLKSFCDKNEIICVAYSPLGCPGRPVLLMDESDPIVLNDPVIKSIAEKNNCSTAQVVLSWGIQRGTCVLPKSVKEHRIEENLKSADINLDEDDMNKINSIETRCRYITGSWFLKEGETLDELWDGEFLG